MLIKRCKKCIMPRNFPDISFDKNGVCSFCNGEKKFGISADRNIMELINKKNKLREDMEEFFKFARGKGGEYDCLVPLSGGKDSAYLLWLLSKKYKLKCLAYHVKKSIVPKLATANVELVASKLGIDLIIYKSKRVEEISNKIYSYCLTKPHSDGCVKTTCRACYLILQSTLMKVAVQKQIPFIAMGFSPDQIEYNFYEIPKDRIYNEKWLPAEIPVEKILSRDELKVYWNPNYYDNLVNFPRFFFPFHVLDYNEEEIVSKIDELSLIPRKKSSPLKTNCHLNWLMMQIDMQMLGYNPYVESFSELIRQGKTSRYKWVFLDSMLSKVLKLGLYKRKEIKYIENELGLSLKKILSNLRR